MTLRQKTLSGISWSFAARLLSQLIKYAILIVLARLLTPQDFGLIGMVAVFIGFLALFTELGFTAALVQRETVTEQHLSSIFWTNVAASTLMMLLLILLAPLIAAFYRTPALIPVIMVISLNFLIGSLNDVQTALAQRAMNFRVLGLVQIASILLGGTVAISLALAGAGVWSLVAQTLAMAWVEVALLWYWSSWKPKWLFDRAAVGEVLGYSTNLLGFNVFNYFVRNADDLLIGRFVDAASLGIYRQGYALMLVPTREITHSIGSVMFPALSRIKSDTAKVKEYFLLSQRIIGFISIPLMAGVCITAEPFVVVLLGEQWRPLIPILRIFSLVGMLQPIDAAVGWIYQSQGRTDLMFKWGVFSGIITVASFIIGVQWGIIGVASAYVIRSYFILWYPGITIPGRLIGLTFWEYLRNLQGIAVATLVMLGVVYLGQTQIPPSWSPLVQLVAQASLGMGVYAVCARGFRLRAYQDIKDIGYSYLHNKKLPLSP